MKVFLEKTTNTHLLEASEVKVLQNVDEAIQVIEIQGEGIVSHGEHGILKIESPHIVKYVQQEFNPVTNMLEQAYD